MRVAIIPARYGSTRFPGKPLAEVFGVPMVERVVRRVEEAGVFDAVVVATDHGGIAERVEAAGARAILTSPDHPNGTLRVWEAVGHLEAGGSGPVTAVVNVQGDEPFVHGEQLRMLAEMISRPAAAVATLARPMEAGDPAFQDPNRVKVVCDAEGRALYFSRSPIPAGAGPWLKHLGLYAYTRAALERIVSLPPCDLEERERLEQLRWVWHGVGLHVGLTDLETPCIDTPEDLERLHAGPVPA